MGPSAGPYQLAQNNQAKLQISLNHNLAKQTYSSLGIK